MMGAIWKMCDQLYSDLSSIDFKLIGEIQYISLFTINLVTSNYN